jgi:hypothetical protein
VAPKYEDLSAWKILKVRFVQARLRNEEEVR